MNYEITLDRQRELWRWPLDNVRLDIRIGLLDPYFTPDSNPSDKELKKEGIVEDPENENAPKNDTERRFVKEVVRPALRKKLAKQKPNKPLTKKEKIVALARRELMNEYPAFKKENHGLSLDDDAVRRRTGAIVTHLKSVATMGKILKEAESVDPEKKRSAYSLAEELEDNFKNKRKTTRKTLSDGTSLKQDTSWRPRGFKKSNIYRVLKDNGWR